MNLQLERLDVKGSASQIHASSCVKPTVLSVIAGTADVTSFLGLGLFSSHVTGNLVILAAHLVAPTTAPFSTAWQQTDPARPSFSSWRLRILPELPTCSDRFTRQDTVSNSVRRTGRSQSYSAYTLLRHRRCDCPVSHHPLRGLEMIG
jgi:Protein of unknown function (DUF1275)